MYNFTLLIPTTDRHQYLRRSIEYFKDLNANVIYCDSSLNKYDGKISANITYLHLPGQKFADKILHGLEYCQTDLVALCADDDFILIDSLYEGANILNGSNVFKTVVGRYISFLEQFDGNFYFRYNNLPSDLIFGSQKNAEVFFHNYYQILWSMYNKKILLESFKIIKQANFNNDNFIELVIGAFACYSGGIKFLDKIWGIRELHSKDHWGAKHKTISNVNNRDEVYDHFTFQSHLDKITFKGYSKIVINSYLKHSLNEPSFVKKIIKSFLPKKVILFLRKKNPSILTFSPIVQSENDKEQLNKIISVLNTHPNKAMI